MKQHYIYLTTNIINGMKYIGKHYGELDDTYLGSGKLLKADVAKYSKEYFQKSVLYVSNDDLENSEKEKQFIALYNAVSNPLFYNIHEGGSGGNTTAGYSPEEKEALRRKLSEVNRGKRNGMYGKRHTEETKAFLSYWAEFERDNSHYQTEEFRSKMSELTTGSNNGMYGKTISDYARRAVIERFSKPVLQLDLNNNIINRFSSASEAERQLNGKGSHVSCCCLGKRKTAYGYKWKYE